MIDMTIDEITEKIIESRNNDIAKAFTMQIGNLLFNNGIVPVMTEYTGNDVKNITDTDEYKLVMEYGIAFKELDCTEHDKKIYNKAIDDFADRLKEMANSSSTKYIRLSEKETMTTYRIEQIAERLKAGVKYEM